MTHLNATPGKAIYLDEFIYEEGTPIGKCYQCDLPNPFTNNQVLTEGIDYVKQWQIRTLGLTEWNNCTQKEYETTYSFPQERRIKALPLQAEKEIKVAHAGNGYSGKGLQAEKLEGEKEMIVKVKNILDGFTEEQRLVVFSFYCNHCGSTNPSCQCWNDD